MEIIQTPKDDVMVVRLAGEIWGRSGEPEQFKALIKRLLANGNTRVVINLSQVRLISSIGLGMLIAGYKALTDAQGMMAVAEPSDPIKPVFRVLRGPFKDFESEDEAVTFVREHRE